MKKFIPKNKTEEWAPKSAFLDWPQEMIKEAENSWLNQIKEGDNLFPFSSFILEQSIIKRINGFIDDFENQGLQLSCELDLVISDEYYKALSNLIVDGKFRLLNVKIADMMPPDRMFITSSQKPT